MVKFVNILLNQCVNLSLARESFEWGIHRAGGAGNGGGGGGGAERPRYPSGKMTWGQATGAGARVSLDRNIDDNIE